MHDVQSKLLEAARLLTEAAAALGQPSPMPAVMQRMQAAGQSVLATVGQGDGQPASMPQRWVGLTQPQAQAPTLPFMLQPQAQPAAQPQPAKRPGRKNVHRGERAYFYLHLAQAQNPNQDVIYRVVGDRGLSEANRLEAEAQLDPSTTAKRINSREYAELVAARLKQIREGAGYLVGCTEAVDLTGPIKRN